MNSLQFPTAQTAAPEWVRITVPAEDPVTVHGHTIAGRPARSYLLADLGDLPGVPGHVLAAIAPAPDTVRAKDRAPDLARVTTLAPDPSTRIYLDDPDDLDPAEARAQAAADIAEAEAAGRVVRILFDDGRVVL